MDPSLVLEEASVSAALPVGTERVRVGLFPGRYETFNLLAPLITPLLALIELTMLRWTGSGPQGEQIRLATFLAATLGLNVLHNYMTFSALFCLPELREWVRRKTGAQPWRFWSRLAFVFFGAFFTVFYASRSHPAGNPYLTPLIVFPTLLLPIHHYISQVFGLSQAYSVKAGKKLNFSKAELRASERNARIERFGKRLILFFYMVVIGCSYVRFGWRYAGVPHALRQELPWIESLCLRGLRAAVCLVLLNALFFPKVFRTNKFWFMTRIGAMFYPVSGAWLAIGTEFTHGFEYLGVYLTMGGRSRIGAQGRKRLHRLTIGLILFGLFLTFFRPDAGLVPLWLGQPFNRTPMAFQLLAIFSLAITVTHYYLDALMFRMRDPETRSLVAPLL